MSAAACCKRLRQMLTRRRSPIRDTLGRGLQSCQNRRAIAPRASTGRPRDAHPRLLAAESSARAGGPPSRPRLTAVIARLRAGLEVLGARERIKAPAAPPIHDGPANEPSWVSAPPARRGRGPPQKRGLPWPRVRQGGGCTPGLPSLTVSLEPPRVQRRSAHQVGTHPRPRRRLGASPLQAMSVEAAAQRPAERQTRGRPWPPGRQRPGGSSGCPAVPLREELSLERQGAA
jgi:hypothetical protein